MKKKIFAVSLAGAMVLGALPAMADEAQATTWEPFEENVTLRVPVYDRGVEGVPDVTNNYWTQWIQENFGDVYNVTVEYVPITRTDVMTSYALLAADQNLPTILMEYDYPKLSTWANDGYLIWRLSRRLLRIIMHVWRLMDSCLTPPSAMRATLFLLPTRIITLTIHGRPLYVWTG